MGHAKASGYTLTDQDAAIVLGMIARGDRHHDIAAWFGVNQGRIAEVQNGSHGSVSAAPSEQLPPKGPPGIKGKRLRDSVGKVVDLAKRGQIGSDDMISRLDDALTTYESHEA